MMENKHPENKSSKKVDKVRRKLLIGAAATPLIMTLHASRAMGQKDIGKLVQNPSKAMRDGDGLGYSGLLVGSGGGNIATELSLYVYLIANNFPVNVPAYANMIAERDTWVVTQVQSATTQAIARSNLQLLRDAIPLNSSWTVPIPSDTALVLTAGARDSWDEANRLFALLGVNPEGDVNDDDSENPDPFSLLDGFPGG